jgi:RNase adapter protein RapZ
MQLILISGLSGSGKSIALKLLEDTGYYCVDNLPATLLPQLIGQLRQEGYERVAVAVDVRSGASIEALPEVIDSIRPQVANLLFLFLDSRDDALIARFSETRRRHPLADDDVTLKEAIAHERDLLTRIAELGHRLDTSALHPNVLRAWIRSLIDLAPSKKPTLLFQSFGFKHGIPVDADFVFDVRCLPNPFYEPELRALTGLDQPVIDFMQATESASQMACDIQKFIARWLPAFQKDGRSYFTIAIGCTGGQHRSVYLVEWLARQFADSARVLVRHRALDAATKSA